MRAPIPAHILAHLTPIVPSHDSTFGVEISGGRRIVKVSMRRFEALKRRLGTENIYIVYEDEQKVVIAGFIDGKFEKPRMTVVSKAWLYGNIRALTSVVR